MVFVNFFYHFRANILLEREKESREADVCLFVDAVEKG